MFRGPYLSAPCPVIERIREYPSVWHAGCWQRGSMGRQQASDCSAVLPAAGGGVAAEAITHSEAQEVHRLLADELGEAQAAADFRSKCQQVFRYAALALLLPFIIN